MDLQEMAWEDCTPCCYGATLPKDSTCNQPCSWTEADPATFLIRGKNYLEDHQKVFSTYFIFNLKILVCNLVFPGIICYPGVRVL